MMEQRPVVARAHVVLAHPDQLYRCPAVDRLDDLGGLQHVVGMAAGAAAEAAAGVQHVDRDLLRLEAEQGGQGMLVAGLHLLAVPYLAATVAESDHAVHRLHGGVRQIGEVVAGADHFGCLAESRVGVTALMRDEAGRLRQFPVAGENLVAAEPEGLAFVPVHREGVASFFRAPGIGGQHRHALGNLHHVDHAFHRPGAAGVEGLDRGAEARRMRHHRHQHARQLHVLGEAGLAVGLVDAVLALDAFADQAEILRVLQFQGGRNGLFRSQFGQFAECGAAPRFRMANHAVAYADLGSRHAPLRRCRADQHGAAGRARLA